MILCGMFFPSTFYVMIIILVLVNIKVLLKLGLYLFLSTQSLNMLYFCKYTCVSESERKIYGSNDNWELLLILQVRLRFGM